MVIVCKGYYVPVDPNSDMFALTFYDVIGTNMYLCPVDDHYVVETWGNENFRF